MDFHPSQFCSFFFVRIILSEGDCRLILKIWRRPTISKVTVWTDFMLYFLIYIIFDISIYGNVNSNNIDLCSDKYKMSICQHSGIFFDKNTKPLNLTVPKYAKYIFEFSMQMCFYDSAPCNGWLYGIFMILLRLLYRIPKALKHKEMK